MSDSQEVMVNDLATHLLNPRRDPCHYCGALASGDEIRSGVLAGVQSAADSFWTGGHRSWCWVPSEPCRSRRRQEVDRSFREQWPDLIAASDGNSQSSGDGEISRSTHGPSFVISARRAESAWTRLAGSVTGSPRLKIRSIRRPSASCGCSPSTATSQSRSYCTRKTERSQSFSAKMASRAWE